MMLFRRIGSALLFLAVLAAPVLAGVNTGGILVAHDANLLASATTTDPICGQGTIPTGCADVDARINGALSLGTSAIFKVYAIFPTGSHPRISGIAWGVYYAATTSIERGWNCADFELADPDWPGSNQGNSVTYDVVKTDLVIPVYVFSAYTDGTAGTIDLTVNPDPHTGGVFGDDTVPSVLDPIAGFGKIGFDADGVVPPCGGYPGACCDRILATCSLKSAVECGTSNLFMGPNTSCTPYPCGTGACCIPGGPTCQDVDNPAACATLGGYYKGLGTVCTPPYNDCAAYGACCNGTTCVTNVIENCAPPAVFISSQPCTPDLCVFGLGACCSQGACSQTTEDLCSGLFWPATSCDTQPCAGSPGACCGPTGCSVSRQQNCNVDATTFFLSNVDCNPDPCSGLGACCSYDLLDHCAMLSESQCTTVWKLGQTCNPNVCQTLGACCTGSLCTITVTASCTGQWISHVPCQPTTCTSYGACCHRGPSPQICEITTEAACDAPWLWVVGGVCNPDPCEFPVLRSTWGQIKNTYKDARR